MRQLFHLRARVNTAHRECFGRFENARLASKGQSATGSTSAKSKPPAKRAASSSSSAPAVRKGKKLKKDDEEEDGEEVSDKDAVGSTKKEVAVLLANKFDLEGKKDPQGYWISEKCLFSVFSFVWSGKILTCDRQWMASERTGMAKTSSTLALEIHSMLRLGSFAVCLSFNSLPFGLMRAAELPKGHTLDGELFHSRNNFSAATSIVRSHNSEKWNEIRFKVRPY